MTVKVHATRMLVRHLNIKPDFMVDARNLRQLLDEVDRNVEGFHDSICDETGKIRTYVNVFINEENVSPDPNAMDLPLHDGDEVYILANVAGGRG